MPEAAAFAPAQRPPVPCGPQRASLSPPPNRCLPDSQAFLFSSGACDVPSPSAGRGQGHGVSPVTWHHGFLFPERTSRQTGSSSGREGPGTQHVVASEKVL